jgi:hypothetical protein
MVEDGAPEGLGTLRCDRSKRQCLLVFSQIGPATMLDTVLDTLGGPTPPSLATTSCSRQQHLDAHASGIA